MARKKVSHVSQCGSKSLPHRRKPRVSRAAPHYPATVKVLAARAEAILQSLKALPC